MLSTLCLWQGFRNQLSQNKSKMPKFKYNFSIEAPTEKEAETKMTALTVLASRLNAKELDKLAHIVKSDPVKTAMAKAALGMT